MKIDRLWILGAASPEMDEVERLLTAVTEMCIYTKVFLPEQNGGTWIRARSEREAFSLEAYADIGDLEPGTIYFVNTAMKLLRPENPSLYLPRTCCYEESDFLLRVRSELRALGKDLPELLDNVYPTGNWFLLCTHYDDFTNPRSGGGEYLDKIKLDAKNETSAVREAKLKWSELARYETGIPKQTWPQSPKLIYESSEKIE